MIVKKTPKKSFIQNDQQADVEITGCPISNSIKERKDAGSPLQTLRQKVVFVPPDEVTVFRLIGTGLATEAPERRSAKDRKSKGVNYIAAFAKK
jgi:hypothetical protein